MYADISWENFVYFGMTILSLPLYVIILGTIIHRRGKKTKFTTTFYALLISLAIADLFSQVIACFASIIRTCNIFNQFYWENRHWVAPMSYNGGMFCINLRFFGATLIAIQRYFVVCLNTHRWTEKLPFAVVFFTHWIIPFLYTLRILANFEKTFVGPNDMRTTMESKELDKDTLMQNIWVLITFFISAFCYLNLIRTVMNGQVIGSSKELRLSVVALGQAVAFTAMFSYFTLTYILVKTESPYTPYFRNYMTILTGAISYWNPWIYYFLNGDIRKEVNKIFLRRKAQILPTVKDEQK